jgi:hypothetical protein
MGEGVVRDASYTQYVWRGGGRQSITLLEGSEASAARLSGKSITK